MDTLLLTFALIHSYYQIQCDQVFSFLPAQPPVPPQVRPAATQVLPSRSKTRSVMRPQRDDAAVQQVAAHGLR